MPTLLASRAGRTFAAALLVLALGTVAGMIVLWPGTVDAPVSQGLAAETERGEIVSLESVPCEGDPETACARARVRVLSGEDSGSSVAVDLGLATAVPELAPGDQVRLAPSESPAGGETAAPGAVTYSLADFERRAPMLWLVIAFALLVIAFARLRGALSLVGLAASLAVVVLFVVPAILARQPPLAVAVVGSLAIVFVTIPLAHGAGPKSIAAMLATAASLVLTVLLAVLFTDLTHLTGLASEEATLLQTSDAGVSIQGLLLAGIVIAALGVLDDMTVSQASAVMALRAANPALGVGELYRRGLRIGQDHVSATVNTLVLAYVGASLPILLLFSSGELGFFETANVEAVAKEIVATLVGSIGLIAAAPIATFLAALLATSLEPERVGGPAHAH